MLAKIRIMVVDDNRIWGELLVEYLRGQGWHAQCFDQVTSIDEVKAWQPDLVLLDVHMPVLRGDELLRAMRSCPELRNIPAIMLTGAAHLDADIVALSQAWFTKPVDLQMLGNLIHQVSSSPQGSLTTDTDGARWEKRPASP